MEQTLYSASFWGHAVTALSYTMLAIWIWHQYGQENKQQRFLLLGLAMTAMWGIAVLYAGPSSLPALYLETARNAAWIVFMFFLLRSGEGRHEPRTVTWLYAIVGLLLFVQPVMDSISAMLTLGGVADQIVAQSALAFHMLYAIGALVLVHNLYTVSAPETRWGIALPMAALTAMWTYDLNLYTISYLSTDFQPDLMAARGVAMAMLAPVFVIASRRNRNWRLQLSRSVAFHSASLMLIGGYLAVMVFIATLLQLIGGTYVRLAQVTLIFGMSITALLFLPSGRFKAWVKVVIAKNFFQHRYDYRNEWMRFADTIGFSSQQSAPFHERVIKSLADIFDCKGGVLIIPDDQGHLCVQAKWNWPTLDIPANCATLHSLPFFESTGHIASMDDVRDGTDTRCDPRAIPQWLFEQQQAWAVVPLVHFGKLAGLIVLARPHLTRRLDWEDLDILRVVGRQLASYLAEASSQKALAESQQFEQFNRRFAFVMHDIKNLVSQLSLLSRNAEKHADKAEFREDMIETLKSSVTKMNELLARLSQHNKLRHDVPIAINIAEAVRNSVHAKRLIYPIDADLPEQLMAIADPSRVETIINHLVQNAIEATNDGSPIRITGRRQGNDIAISVSDNGVGMSEAFIANDLFKPFFSTKKGGFGIGAYEARELVQSMGGQLRVESRQGKGSRFTLLLPQCKDIAVPHDLERAA